MATKYSNKIIFHTSVVFESIYTENLVYIYVFYV